jgi:hypothetical protein
MGISIFAEKEPDILEISSKANNWDILRMEVPKRL